MQERQTALFKTHQSLGAKMVTFAGFLLPLHYKSIIYEHQTTRRHAALFDTSHMGEFLISEGEALNDLENLVSCRLNTMTVGQCRYGFICNHQGGVIDDQITYRMGDNEFLMVVNAATQKSDFEWIASHLSKTTRLRDLSDETSKIDIQGPASAKIVQKLTEEKIDGMKFYSFRHNRYRGKPLLISRTGYTGELGFEIYAPPDLAVAFWNNCIELGAVPAGLGARDTLRLEMCFPLYGNELRSDRNAGESGLFNAIAEDKEFIGSSNVLDLSQRSFHLVAMVLKDRRSARTGDTLFDKNGVDVGVITSGSFSPSLGRSIAMGYIRTALNELDTLVGIRTDRYELEATIQRTPLYKEATGRKKLKRFL